MKERIDTASLIGFAAAGLALLVFVAASGGDFKLLLSFPPILFIVAGSFAITLIGFSLQDCGMLRRIVTEAFVEPPDHRGEILEVFADAAQRMRKDGPLAIESLLPSVPDAITRKGLEMIVDGLPLRAIRDYVEEEAERLLYPYEMGIGFFRKMGGYSPTLGIVGTIVGLMSAFANLAQFKIVGGSVAEAFVATLWGVAFANGVCFPLANKLEYRKRAAEEELEMIFQGLIQVRRGASRRAVREKMAALAAARARAGAARPWLSLREEALAP